MTSQTIEALQEENSLPPGVLPGIHKRGRNGAILALNAILAYKGRVQSDGSLQRVLQSLVYDQKQLYIQLVKTSVDEPKQSDPFLWFPLHDWSPLSIEAIVANYNFNGIEDLRRTWGDIEVPTSSEYRLKEDHIIQHIETLALYMLRDMITTQLTPNSNSNNPTSLHDALESLDTAMGHMANHHRTTSTVSTLCWIHNVKYFQNEQDTRYLQTFKCMVSRLVAIKAMTIDGITSEIDTLALPPIIFSNLDHNACIQTDTQSETEPMAWNDGHDTLETLDSRKKYEWLYHE